MNVVKEFKIWIFAIFSQIFSCLSPISEMIRIIFRIGIRFNFACDYGSVDNNYLHDWQDSFRKFFESSATVNRFHISNIFYCSEVFSMGSNIQYRCHRPCFSIFRLSSFLLTDNTTCNSELQLIHFSSYQSIFICWKMEVVFIQSENLLFSCWNLYEENCLKLLILILAWKNQYTYVIDKKKERKKWLCQYWSDWIKKLFI